MPDSSSTLHEIKISELPVATAVSDSDQLEANQAGTSRSITVGQVKAAAVAAVPVPPPLPPLGFLHAGSFGVVTGTTANQSVALQAAIDAAEAQKLKLVLPAGYIRIDNTIYLGRTDPVWVEGQQAHAFNSFTDNAADDVTCLYCANLPSNVSAVQITPTITTGTRDGVTLKNVTIYRPVPSTAGAGDKGVWIKACTKPCLEDLVISGFDIGLHCGINSDGSRATYLGNFRNVRIDQSGNYAGLIESCVDCLFDHCWFGGATIAGMAITLPSILGAGNTTSNGNYWEHCTFIASQGTVPVNNVRVDCGFWNSFDTCAFEAASGETLKVDYTAAANNSGHANARVDVVLMNCWFNNGVAGSTGLINIKDANFEIIGGRAGTSVSTDAAIKIAQSFFSIATFDACIVGMQVVFQAVAGITVTGAYEGLRIIGCNILDLSATGLPCIVVATSTASRGTYANNRFKTTHARGYTDASELTGAGNIFLNNLLTANTSSDNYTQKALGGPVLAFAGQTPKTAEYGVSQATASRLYTRHTADSGGVFHFFYKTRQTVPGGARAAVSAGDGVALRRFYADDGAADQEVVRETVNVDAIAANMGGSWEIFTKSSGTGSLVSRFKLDNLGNVIVPGPLFCIGNTLQYLGGTTGADTITVTPSPAFTAYVTGASYIVKAGATNATTTPTLNVSGLGAKTIVKRASTALAAGDILIGMMCYFVFNGTNMQLLNPVVP